MIQTKKSPKVFTIDKIQYGSKLLGLTVDAIGDGSKNALRLYITGDYHYLSHHSDSGMPKKLKSIPNIFHEYFSLKSIEKNWKVLKSIEKN